MIIKNNILGQIKWEQIVFLGNPEYGVDLHPSTSPSLPKRAAAGNLRQRPENVPPPSNVPSLSDPAWSRSRRPFRTPMPPHVTVKQALHFVEALARGEPDRGRIALTLYRDKVAELF